jgi:hypothetical protein
MVSKNNIHGFNQTNTTGYVCNAIYFSSATNVTGNRIDNNLIYDMNGAGSTTVSYGPIGIRITGGTGFQIAHNTINLTGAFSGSGTGYYSICLYISAATTAMDLRNNIFYNSMTGNSSKIYTVYTVTGSTFNPVDYNDYFSTGNNLGYYGADVVDFTAWQAATSQDLNSLNVDPGFPSATNLIPTSAAMPREGIYLATMPTDFAGVIRLNPPDVGAYEFTPAGIPVIIIVTGTIASPLDTCYNATNTITTAGGGNTFEVQAGASATFIAWEKISFLPGTTVQLGGYLHGYISYGEFCNAPASPAFTTAAEETVSPEETGHETFSIYPNPTTGNFILVQKYDRIFSNVQVEVLTMHGATVKAETITGDKKHEFGFSGMPAGIYLVKVIADGYVETMKMVKM